MIKQHAGVKSIMINKSPNMDLVLNRTETGWDLPTSYNSPDIT